MRVVPLALLVAVTLACETPAPDPDQALFRRAYDLTVAGKEDEALELYRAILRPDGGSRYRPEAHLALAERFFLRGEFTAALEHYRAVEAVPTAPTRPYALYKQGWCYLNMGDAARAREVWERVVALERDESIPEAQRRPLIEAARKDLVKAFAKSGAPDEASAYFQKMGGAAAPALLESLADAYAEEGQWDRAASLSRELIAAHVDSPRLCAWQANTVRAALASGTQKDQLAEVQRLGAVLARLEGNKQTPAAALEDCRRLLRDTSKELVLQWHKKAQKTKDPQLFELADPLYRQYLTRFAAEKDSYEMTFLHAEALWNLQRWAEASDEYRRVVEMNPAGPHTKEAAYASVLAAKNASEGEPARPQTKPVTTPQPLSPGDRRLLSAFELYIARVPSAPELPAIEFRRARLLYDRGHLEESLPFLWQLVQRHPDSELAIYAGYLYLDVLNALGREAAVCTAVGSLLAGPLAARDAEAQRQWRALAADCQRPRSRPSPATK
jgi:tetratricopeptide (TPR) repeat protein